MDYKDCASQRSVFVLQGDGLYLKKILSRESFAGQSSGIYYRGTTEGVPFKWEMQPGTPKCPPKEAVIPPPTPPPAVQSLMLPRPYLDQPKESTWSRVWFWRKSHKSRKEKKVLREQYHHSEKFERFEFQDSDGDFASSIANSRYSSSSHSSLSSSSAPSLERPKDTVDGPFSCSPWNITSIMVRVARRI